MSFNLDVHTVLENSVQTPYGPKLYFESVDADNEFRSAKASGYIQLIDPNGISVISDIDDTVKITNVADRRELLANTLLREFVAVRGYGESLQNVVIVWSDISLCFSKPLATDKTS